MFNLQANSFEIANGIKTDLDMQVNDTGLTITGFNIMSFNYPENIQNMINKNAEQSMIGDMNRYQQVAMADSMTRGSSGSSAASDMAGMMQNMNSQPYAQATPNSGTKPNFCPNCGQQTGSANFCSNCGQKLV